VGSVIDSTAASEAANPSSTPSGPPNPPMQLDEEAKANCATCCFGLLSFDNPSNLPEPLQHLPVMRSGYVEAHLKLAHALVHEGERACIR
jgi:hypothetical protein